MDHLCPAVLMQRDHLVYFRAAAGKWVTVTKRTPVAGSVGQSGWGICEALKARGAVGGRWREPVSKAGLQENHPTCVRRLKTFFKFDLVWPLRGLVRCRKIMLPWRK